MKIDITKIKIVKEGSFEINTNTKQLNTPSIAANIAKQLIGSNDRESLIVFSLNIKNEINDIEINSTGSLNSSIVHPREVFKSAILSNAASIIIVHNHPSGHIDPSKEDINLTKRINKCSKIMGIELLDHIIIGWDCERYYSFKSEGLI